MIESTLNFIKTQIGIDLQLCCDFTGIRQHNGKNYFNVVLNDRVSESNTILVSLERFAHKTKKISVEPNGLKRVAIFIL